MTSRSLLTCVAIFVTANFVLDNLKASGTINGHIHDSESFDSPNMDLKLKVKGQSETNDNLEKKLAASDSTVLIKAPQNKTECQCVDCQGEDKLCGDLWKGMQLQLEHATSGIEELHQKEIHIVVAHCKKDLHFLATFTEEFTNIASIHILTKCGHPVNGAPAMATIETLPNVGRCDHGYAYYINKLLQDSDNKFKVSSDDAVILFIKDNMTAENLHQPGSSSWTNLGNMVRRVSYSHDGFACGIVPGKKERSSISAYAEFDTLQNFFKSGYTGRQKYNETKEEDQVEFRSPYGRLGGFYNHTVKQKLHQHNIVRVCYGGVFATSLRNIRQHSKETWESLEHALTRGDNIAESHYMERIWGLLLSQPLKTYQATALREHANHVYHIMFPFAGLLVRRGAMI